MANYEEVRVKLANNQLKKLQFEIKNKAEAILRIDQKKV